MASSPQLSIILPCYNEADTLPALFTRFGEVLGGRTGLAEVIFVNNGSTDNSQAVLQLEMTRPGRDWARAVDVPVNQGYGYGILAGLREARGDYIGWTHADSQYDPAVVLEGFRVLTQAAAPGRSFLQGRRVRRNWFDGFFTAGMSVIASLVLGVRVRDVNAQPKLFPRTFLALLPQPPHDFSLDLYALYMARREGFAILETSVNFGRRTHGEAKGGGSFALKWKLTKRTFSYILKLRRDLRRGPA